MPEEAPVDPGRRAKRPREEAGYLRMIGKIFGANKLVARGFGSMVWICSICVPFSRFNLVFDKGLFAASCFIVLGRLFGWN